MARKGKRKDMLFHLMRTVMKRFREYNQRQPYLLPPSLDEFVKEKDLVRIVDDVVGTLDLTSLLQRYGGGGCPAYHPQMMLKVLVYAYCTKVYSSRQIAKLLKRDLHFMWLSGRQQPDFRTVNRFRGEYLKGAIESVFAGVVRLLIEEGHVRGEDYFLDGTKLEANANRHKVVWKKNTTRVKDSVENKVREILAEVDRINAEEDERYGDADLPEYGEGSNVTPEKISEVVERINEQLRNLPPKTRKKLKRQAKELTKLTERLAKYDTQEELLGDRNSYSLTDPDATAMRMKDNTCKPAYNVQAGTDGGFVLGYSVHQNGNDAKTLRRHLEQRETLKLPAPRRIVADSVYGTEENYRELQKRQIENFLKYPLFHADLKGQHQPFARESFAYDKKRDLYTCPGNRELVFIGKEQYLRHAGAKRHWVKRYQCRSCARCEFKPLCSPEEHKRTIRRSVALEQFKQQARNNLCSPEGIALRKRRGNEVESVFGDLKGNQNYRRIRLRGIKKASLECGLLFTSLNIRKLALSSQSLTH